MTQACYVARAKPERASPLAMAPKRWAKAKQASRVVVCAVPAAVLEQAHAFPLHPVNCRCQECPHFDKHPDVDANDDLILAERVGDFEVGMRVDVPQPYGNLTGVIEYIYFSEGDPCLCIYFEEVPRYGLRGQRQDVFVSVLLEARREE